jgi:membrane protease subunit HflK
MIGLVILFFFSGIFTVPSQERAIILRFGKPVGAGEQQLLGPGLHWSFPSPIDEIVRIPIGEVQTVTSTAGWYQTTREAELSGQEPPPNATLNPAVDGYTITADGNIIHVRATVRYRITDPLNYVLGFVNASNVLQNVVNNALFYTSTFFDAGRATREDQLAFKEMLVQRVRDLAREQQLGVVIDSAEVTTIPPRQVRSAFDAVSTAALERRKARDDAQAYAGRTLSTAKGEADAIINQGKADATRLIQQVAAEAKYFKDQLPNYEKNPEMFRARLQAEVMGRVLTNVTTVFALPQAPQDQPAELRLLLNAPPRLRNPNEQQGAQGGQR